MRDSYSSSVLEAQTVLGIFSLEEMSRDADWYFRLCVAGNKNCPSDILERLSADDHEHVRITVATRSECKVSWIKAHLGKYHLGWFHFNRNMELK
jgi:hypothetical protein